ncbi:MAG: hypothetical protein HY553_07705 [Elusimicrobia bacterium]|nr:hypothetical protein [Elusimicrobiota bacterium]
MEDKTSQRVVFGIILLAAASRLLPHPPNVTPLTAIALLGGASLPAAQAFLLPLAALAMSDLFLGFHATIPFVYAGFLATAAIGLRLKADRGAGRIAAACLASSILFFVVSNVGVWLASGLYPRTGAGLSACFTAALPFFRNSLLGDAAFTALLFGLERLSVRALAARPVAA